MKTILLATGGTGGHIFPALFTAEELRRRGYNVEFIGVLGQAKDKLVAAGFSVQLISAQGFVAKGPLKVVSAFFSLIRACLTCGKIIGRMKPDVVMGFGGYSSFPTVFMACLLGRVSLVHEQNVMPGVANRVLAGFVKKVCVGFKDSLSVFPSGKAVWTGTPFRPVNTSLNSAEAARRFGLDPAKPTVFVFGGSQGARRINQVFFEAWSAMPDDLAPQVIHATGKLDFPEYEKKYAAFTGQGRKVSVQPFFGNVDEIYAACDLVIGRAGAGTVTELAAAGIRAVLIPYPGANNHQFYNARVLERLGQASIIEEKSLSSQVLRDKIHTVLKLAFEKGKTSRREFQDKTSQEFPLHPSERVSDELEVFLR